MAKPQNLHIATILGAHGVKGQVRVRSFTENPERLFTFKKITDESGAHEFVLKRHGVGKDHFIASIKGIPDRNAAELLRGTKLFVKRDELPPLKKREYYQADLIGLEAHDANGKKFGTVLALHNYGAGAFLEIQPARDPSFMLPFSDVFVPAVDLDAGQIVVDIPPDWLDNKSPSKKTPAQSRASRKRNPT